jgi:hypothetical protein
VPVKIRRHLLGEVDTPLCRVVYWVRFAVRMSLPAFTWVLGMYLLPTLSLAELAVIFLAALVLCFGATWIVRTIRASLLLRRIRRFIARIVWYLRGDAR